ncbi:MULTISPECIES: D-alanine--D-alanine ligase [unclassified Acinetobacter]|uniref:D-alanine--D-alanine ligase family protein n=1 Tax=unclassified Acinetobacter TaxID=196816 RepID=UPI00293432D8|nr:MULTISPECIES: D-alanine--D-alanine ligase [unclassified Acinetobacter]WOE33288.1 D-alanine--D-alanine ligase [Acinetobacter sp. SAAs470]WOE36934.1 D-alanine--D-alanine ligase [Acinetobacter sp. SAAs474]
MNIDKLKIAVLFGGNSSEREISIESGVQVVKALQQAGHEVLAIDAAQGLLDEVTQKKLLETGSIPLFFQEKDSLEVSFDQVVLTKTGDLIDVDIVFLVLHGGTGEDGTTQGMLDMAKLSYTGSGHLGSALAMDKDIAKRLLIKAGVPTPDWLMAPVEPQIVENTLGFPVIVKPNKQGSTIGLTLVKYPNQLEDAVNLALEHDNEVMIEKFIEGRELTVGILADKALTVGEIILPLSGIYDYESKCQMEAVDVVFPAKISPEQANQTRHFAISAHKALKLNDYSRADFRMDRNGNIWCLEIETLPGMRATSLLPQSAAASGISFPQLCEEIASLAVKRKKLMSEL